MQLFEGEITYLLKLISEDKATPDPPKRLLARRLERMRDESRESTRLLQMLERMAQEHKQMLETIEQEQQIILRERKGDNLNEIT